MGRIEPVAVVGMSFGFPQDATSSEAFWKILMEQRNTATDFPADRLNVDAIYHPDTNRRGQISVRGGNFIAQDIAAFDAPFFAISTADAAVMDPQQRGLLEYTYKALENAGMPLEAVTGSKTSVYTGCFTNDWQHICFKDSERCETTTALGAQPCVNANRISWFFNFTGNSANIDTACSSSLVALDMGCKGLLCGDTEMSVVAGCNLIFSPDMMHSLTNMNMLSPDGRCYSFDHRGNGYGRGEGFGVLILKRMSDAIRDNDTIRGVIRNTGCNQDGYTPGITQPNSVSQETLIRETYSKAGLSMGPTRYFEAHGTGTPVGDPIESSALGAAFRKTRTLDDPLWVGAVKSNIGHLEGASGIAGLIKTILVLERAIIPPNALFESTNPKIDTEFLKIMFPLKPMPWPTRGLRRASVNSFGFAGTNAHVILDDTFHYLSEHGLRGHHITIQNPPSHYSLDRPTTSTIDKKSENDQNRFGTSNTLPRLLIFSVNDEKGMKRISAEYGAYFAQFEVHPQRLERYLSDLAHTLNTRRSLLPWKSFAVVQSLDDLKGIEASISAPQRSVVEPALGFIFTGQGAQWAGMGLDLLKFPAYERSIKEAEEYFVELGSSWNLREEILKDNDFSNINRPELSQPICTALQIALVDLLNSFQVRPRAVVGHSSGEIAAAYCIGAISAKAAWKIAFLRGIVASGLVTSQKRQGAMMSVALSKHDIQPYIDGTAAQYGIDDLTVACINSPKNVTVSGEVAQIDALKAALDADGIFARKLLVDVAYHSPHMLAVAEEYRSRLQEIEKNSADPSSVTMISSVVGKRIDADEVTSPEYWVSNLVSPVRFSDAVNHLFLYSARKTQKKLDLSHRGHFSINMLVEIGPHSALQGPIRDTLNHLPNKTNATYTSLLTRKTSGVRSFLMALGQMKCLGYPIELRKLGYGSAESQDLMALPDLPEYPFDHSKPYWYESRLSERFRTHFQGKLDLLGKPVPDWNPLEAKWRNVLRVADMPWIEDHIINSALVYPGAGMLVMAIEAANQMADPFRAIVGFEIKDATFMRSLNIPQDTTGVEVQLSLHLDQNASNAVSTWTEFRLCAFEKPEWYECCRGFIRVEYQSETSEVDSGKEKAEELKSCLQTDASIAEKSHCSIDPKKLYETLNNSGFGFGPSFQPILSGVIGDDNETKAEIKLFEWPVAGNPQPHVVHPTSLDGMLHLAIAGYANGGETAVPTMIPTLLRSIWISKSGLSHPENSQVQACTWMTGQDNRGFDFDGSVLDSAKTNVLVRINGLRLTIIADAAANGVEDSFQTRQICYNIRHHPDPGLMDPAQSSKLSQTISGSIAPLALYLTVLTHKNPNMKVLEIDSGRGAMTTKFLRGLSSIDVTGKATKRNVTSYTYTNSHQEVVDLVRDDLTDRQKVTFQRLDTTTEVTDQDWEPRSYDLVVASDFSDEKSTAEGVLNLAQKLLRVGGKLLMCKPTKRDGSKQHVDTGLWQTGSSATESTTPVVAGLPVGTMLESCGFLPPEMILPSISSDCNEEQMVLASSPIAHLEPTWNGKKIVIVADAQSSVQSQASERLCKLLSYEISAEVDFCGIHEASRTAGADEAVFVVLEELDRPLLYKMTSEKYPELRRFLISARDILWVNPYGGSLPANPEYAVLWGLARAVRNEYENHKLTTIALDVDGYVSDQQMRLVHEILRKNHTHSNLMAGEPEYIEMDNVLNIPRVVQNPNLSQDIFTRSMIQQSGESVVKLAPPLILKIGSLGLLDTLHFVEDERFLQPMADDEVEVETKSIGMNFKDILTALGQVPNSTFGLECAGIVTRAGQNSELVPGDKILMAAASSFATYSRGKISAACKMPEGMSFVEAAAIPAQFTTAWEVVHEMARLRKGESILIHAGAGGTGQAAIQIARYIGATVFATVGSNIKKALLMEQYGIPEDHIFYSRDIGFAKGIQRVTKGRGVDVVINSLAGLSLEASWECIASYGRFIEIGKKDIMSNSKLPMLSFSKNASFMGFDASTWQEERPLEARRHLKILVDLIANKTFHTPYPLHVYCISQIEEVFRLMQDGKTSGKIVLEVTPDALVKTTLNTQPSFDLDPNATYVIAGGLGGLGRSMARWMISRKAKNIILLSRSGARTDVAHKFLDEVKASGVRVEAPACDVTNMGVMQEVFGHLAADMPPIRGCIQGSMVRRDELFENMEFDAWQAGVECKTVGSWNLHTILPHSMDFFIFLSSASGLVGLRGQTNYAAGNTYEDALARYRVARGEKAVSLDLGAMIDDGLLAETPELLNRVLAYGALNPVSRRQFYGILDYFCNPSLPLLSAEECQAVIGLGAGGGPGLDGVDLSRQPMLLHLLQIGKGDSVFGPGNQEDSFNFRELLSESTSWIEAGNLVMQALIEKLSKSLSTMQISDVDVYKPLHAYGVDSLLAVELRNWIAKEFQADVAVFETLGGSTISSLGMLVAGRSALKHESWTS